MHNEGWGHRIIYDPHGFGAVGDVRNFHPPKSCTGCRNRRTAPRQLFSNSSQFPGRLYDPYGFCSIGSDRDQLFCPTCCPLFVSTSQPSETTLSVRMGVCASCLGRGRQDSFDEVSADWQVSGRSCLDLFLTSWQDEESRLLLDDPNNFQYGSFGDQNMNAQADPLESQREIEALQKVVAKTSKYV